jgi:hypothetical protein
MGSEDAELQAYYPHRDLAYGHIPSFGAPPGGSAMLTSLSRMERHRPWVEEFSLSVSGIERPALMPTNRIVTGPVAGGRRGWPFSSVGEIPMRIVGLELGILRAH